MNFFIRNLLLLHALALVVAFSWIHGGTRPDLLLPVIPWLSLFALEFLLIFPQAKSTETLAEARLRVWRALARDPLLYLLILLTALLVIPLFNVAGAPQLDPQTNQWRNAAPPWPGLPFCVRADEHAALLLWFPPALIAALAVRHGLLKKGKRLLLELLCWNGAALALFGFAQLATGAKSIFWGKEPFSHFFSTFGYPNLAGAFFTLLFALSFGLWFSRVNDKWIGPSSAFATAAKDDTPFYERHYLLLAVALNAGAAIASLSRAAILLCGLVFLVLALYMAIGAWQRTGSAGHMVIVSLFLGMVFLSGLGLTVFAPKALKQEVGTITPAAVVDRVTGRSYYHARIAKEIFRDYPVFGVGGWGYPHYLMQYITPEETKHLQIQGGANVHNDSLQFLAEQGVVGYGLLLLCVAALLLPILWQAFRLCRELAKNTVPSESIARPAWLYRLPPEFVAVLVGTAATVCHSLGDLPFRSPAVLTVWVLALVCAAGFLPAVRRK